MKTLKSRKSKKVAEVQTRLFEEGALEEPLEVSAIEITDAGVLYFTTVGGKRGALPPWRWVEVEFV